MNPRTIVVAAAMCFLPAVATVGAANGHNAAPQAPYLQALRVADLFLHAWVRRDDDVGLALLSGRILPNGTGPQDSVRAELRLYMTGLSNPHHEAFEIHSGHQVGTDRFAFAVSLFELYLGASTGFAYSDTLEVARQGEVWRVDRLPRNYSPD